MWLLQALRKQLNASRALKSLETPQQRAERKAEVARERQARKEEKAAEKQAARQLKQEAKRQAAAARAAERASLPRPSVVEARKHRAHRMERLREKRQRAEAQRQGELADKRQKSAEQQPPREVTPAGPPDVVVGTGGSTGHSVVATNLNMLDLALLVSLGGTPTGGCSGVLVTDYFADQHRTMPNSVPFHASTTTLRRPSHSSAR